MSTTALQTSANAFPSSFSGQHVQIAEVNRTKISLPKTKLQKVQESDGKNWLFYQLFLRQDYDACQVPLAAADEITGPAMQSNYAIYMKGLSTKLRKSLFRRHL
jgi:hypothetical protein